MSCDGGGGRRGAGKGRLEQRLLAAPSRPFTTESSHALTKSWLQECFLQHTDVKWMG
jgi:hypothetical protein